MAQGFVPSISKHAAKVRVVFGFSRRRIDSVQTERPGPMSTCLPSVSMGHTGLLFCQVQGGKTAYGRCLPYSSSAVLPAFVRVRLSEECVTGLIIPVRWPPVPTGRREGRSCQRTGYRHLKPERPLRLLPAPWPCRMP